MKLKTLASVLLVLVIAVSCTGPKGDMGDQGPVGPAGPEQPGVYYIRHFQQGVYGSFYAGQVEASLFSGYGGATNTSDTLDVSIGRHTIHPSRAIFKFDISSLPSSKVIVEKAEFTVNTNLTSLGGGAQNVGVYKVNTEWTVNQTGWIVSSTGIAWPYSGAIEPGANTVTVNTGYYDLPPDSKITIELDPALVQDWMLNPATNYGVILKSQDESLLNYSEIYPSLAADTSKRPMLKIWYYTTE